MTHIVTIPTKSTLGLPPPVLGWLPGETVSGRDGSIIAKALAYAIEAIEEQPDRWKERSDQHDMKLILSTWFGDVMRASAIHDARCHLSHGQRRVFDFPTLHAKSD